MTTAGPALARRGRLPAEVNSFVGRRHELGEVRRLMETGPMVTLVGPGGVGKTRLALRAADGMRKAFPDGVWLVELADLDTAEGLARFVLQALETVDVSDSRDEESLVSFLADRHLLLLLDNCEHLVADTAQLVDLLLRSCPGLRVLATSREALGIQGELQLRVPPLGIPVEGTSGADSAPLSDAVTLFSDRAAVTTPGFRLTEDNVDDVVRIVTQLDGLPLAIELAAARLGVLSTAELAERLGDRYRLLTDGRRVAPGRHQTLRLCVDWSHQQCSAAERTLWSRLSIFVGGFEIDAVEGVCAFGEVAADDVVDLLGSLVGKSIVARAGGEDRARFKLLETMRAYGRERLHESGEQGEVRSRHRRWFLDLAMGSGGATISSDQRHWWSRLDREQANVRAAFEATCAEDGEAAADLVMAIEPYLGSRAQCREIRHWLGEVLTATEGRPSLSRQAALAGAVTWESLSGANANATRLAAAAEVEAATLDDRLATALASYGRGFACFGEGDIEGSARFHSAALAGFRAEGAVRWEIETLSNLTHCFALAGRLADAERLHDEAMQTLVPRGELHFRAHLHRQLGSAKLLADDWDRAAELIAESLRLFAEIADREGFVRAVGSLALCEGHFGNHERATVLAAAASAIQRDLGMRPIHAASMHEVDLAREASAREALGEHAYAAAAARGSAMDHAEIVAFALRRQVSPGGADRVTDRTSTLTGRELEVAALIAEGLTNNQIAARLVVTSRTARGHVENIFTKLGVNSRAQVATWYTGRQS